MAKADERSSEDFYRELRQKLDQEHEFPSLYMFKFIIPNDNQKLALVEALFGNEAQVTIRESRKGNFLSITGKEIMVSADRVIERYQQAESIEGIVSL